MFIIYDKSIEWAIRLIGAGKYLPHPFRLRRNNLPHSPSFGKSPPPATAEGDPLLAEVTHRVKPNFGFAQSLFLASSALSKWIGRYFPPLFSALRSEAKYFRLLRMRSRMELKQTKRETKWSETTKHRRYSGVQRSDVQGSTEHNNPTD